MPNRKPRPQRKKASPSRIDPACVARVAYELYRRRGGGHGHDVEDWLEAERLLQQEFRRRARGPLPRDPRRRAEDLGQIRTPSEAIPVS